MTNNSAENLNAVELVADPTIRIKRSQYLFMVQTHFLTERQQFAEAFLRGLVCGQEGETVTDEIKSIMDTQMRQDFEKFNRDGNDYTPVFMNHRASVAEAIAIIKEAFNEFARLKCVGASIHSLGVQLEFVINCLKRTVFNNDDDLQQIRQAVSEINKAFQQVTNQSSDNMNSTQSSAYVTAQNQSTFNANINSPWNATFPSTPNQIPMYQPIQANISYAPNNLQTSSPQPANNFNSGNGNLAPSQNRLRSPTSTNRMFDRNRNQNYSLLNSSANNSLIGPHKVSSTIVNIISKNPYEIGMDAVDQLETWESQAESLAVPIDYFLSYMEVLLSKNVQGWWRVYRPNIKTWEQFKRQFAEDFGDQNRVIKAEQEIANLTQGMDESFQQLFLRFTKLMGYIKPAKSLTDQIYILRSALKPVLRTACMTATSIAEIKKICNEYEGMEKIHMSRKSGLKTGEKVNIVESRSETEMETDRDFWNNVAEFDKIGDDEDVIMVIDEVVDKKRTAMIQQWNNDKKREWLSKQLCWNCDTRGHLQGQCDKKWIPHCVKCGNKQVATTRDCNKCQGNGQPLTPTGAQR